MSSFATSLPPGLLGELSISSSKQPLLSRSFVNRSKDMENTIIGYLRIFPSIAVLGLDWCESLHGSWAACHLQRCLSFGCHEGAVAAKCRKFEHAAKASENASRRDLLQYRTHQWQACTNNPKRRLDQWPV